MTDRTILVVAAEDDLTADMVISQLGGHAVTRIDPLRMDGPVTVSGFFTQRGWMTEVAAKDRWLSPGYPTAVYWRKPTRPDQLEDPDQKWLADENTIGLLGLLEAAEPGLWVNHPHANERSRLKQLQLRVAAKAGFEVPETLLTNDPDQARAFVARHDQVVLKTLTQRYTTLIPTTVVTPSDDLSGVAGCLHHFQRMVDKTHDIRLTVVGDQFFACRVTTDSADLDWRATERAEITYESVETPSGIVPSCRTYMASMSLAYAAFDFAVDREGLWWFLEANPNGEFGFIEAATGLPISKAIADLLKG